MIRSSKRFIMPVVSWSSDTEMVVTPVVNDVQMNNGTWLKFDGGTPLVMNTGVAGLGGVDDSGIATSAWHSMYLVPDGKYVDVVGSQADARTEGPTGYTVYRYIGSFLVDSDDDLVHTYQHGNRVSTCDHYWTGDVVAYANLAFGGTPDTWYQKGNFTTNAPSHQRRGRMDINWGLDHDGTFNPILSCTTYDGVPGIAPVATTTSKNPFVGASFYHNGNGCRGGSFSLSRVPGQDNFYMSRGYYNDKIDMGVEIESCEDRYLE